MLTRAALAFAILLGCLMTYAAPAHADHPPIYDPLTGNYSRVVHETETLPGSGTDEPGSGGGARVCFRGGAEVACAHEELGRWNDANQCYMQHAVNVSPTMRSADGRTDGSYYTCTAGDYGLVRLIWVPPGEEPVAVPVDPVVVAREATALLQLATAQVRTAPAAPDISYVNLETWLWVPGEQWVPLSASATAGATTVSVIATPTRVVWDMGDGQPAQTCTSPGREWFTSYDDSERTDCSYVYRSTSADAPGETFTVSAEIFYSVTWTCSGACTRPDGTLVDVSGPAGTSGLQVGQRQTVIVEGP